MSDLTNYTEDVLINHTFRTSTYTPPASLYFGLLTGITDAEAGIVTEVGAGVGYNRIGAVRNGTNFGRTGNVISSLLDMTFSDPTGDWNTCTHLGVWDASSGGNLLAVTALGSPKVILAASPAPVLGAGSFTFTLNYQTDYLSFAFADWLFIGTAFAKPTSLQFGLTTTAPTSSSGGTEVIAASYARVSITPLDATFTTPAGGNGLTANVADAVFPPPAATAFGVVDAIVLYNGAGNDIVTFKPIPPVPVNANDLAPQIDASAFSFALA